MKINTKKTKTVLGALLIVFAVLMIGMLGGIWGFLMLSNTTSPTIQKFRRAIGLADNPAIPAIVTKKFDLVESSAVVDVAKKVSPSVVSVVTKYQVQDFFGNSREGKGGGSGFIITEDGYIITNKHVVDGQSSISVVLPDGTEHDAKLVSADPFFDIAVVKIEAKGLPVVDLGDSDKTEIGQTVIAIGNAFGEFQNTVTTGVLSAKNRTISASAGSSQTEKLTGLLQTDAAINPGNSGGPLLNIAGQVIGINTAIASSSGASAGVGFAIPVNTFRGAIESTIQNGRIIRPGLGVRYMLVTKALAEKNNLTVQHGALVTHGETLAEVAVVAGSSADKAGIKEGDIILSINGEDVTTDNTLTQLIGQYKVGETIKVVILRDGKQQTKSVTLEELK